MPSVDLSGWHDFFVIVGGSAGVLIGLMFVAITLAAQGIRRTPEVRRVMRSFATPTIVHLTTVLSTAAVLAMPGMSLKAMNVFLVSSSVALLAYVGWIHANSRRFHETYKPDLEDLIWHFVLPALAYGSILVAASAGWNSPGTSLYVISSAMVALLIIGIHNAWDSAVFQISRDPEQ